MITRFAVLPIGIYSGTKLLLRFYKTKNKIDVVDALTVQLNEKLQQEETFNAGLVFLRLPHPRTGVYHILLFYLHCFLMRCPRTVITVSSQCICRWQGVKDTRSAVNRPNC